MIYEILTGLSFREQFTLHETDVNQAVSNYFSQNK